MQRLKGLKGLTKGSKGFALLDVLMAIFIFGLGFSVFYGLNESALSEAQQAQNLSEAANIAQSQLERLIAHSWRADIDQNECIPGGTVMGTEGKFKWSIVSAWNQIRPDLLEVQVKISWQERGRTVNYVLGSIYHVE